MSLRILVFSPRFAPINGADTHRLRLLLNHASDSGWEVQVLTVEPANIVGPIDPWLEEALPKDIPIHRVPAWSLKGWGLNGLAQRSFWPLYRKGSELLSTGRFDLVFFSTTEFALHMLGPMWRSKYRVPFCMDYQDPWVNDYYRQHPEVVPPGGRIKYAVADRIHRAMERITVRSCGGFLAVSEAYLTDLRNRYGSWVATKPELVRPFPAEPAELDVLQRTIGEPPNPRGSPKVWRYVGRGGADMAKAASAFFSAWRQAIWEGHFQRHAARFEAMGTSYAAAGLGKPTFKPLVKGVELADLVREDPTRLRYSEMLRTLLTSDALVVFGSDDPAYTASKIYPYLLARRPMLVIVHARSPLGALLSRVGGAVCVTFESSTPPEELAERIFSAWFLAGAFERVEPLDYDAFEPHTARAQARDVLHWFREVLHFSQSKMRAERQS